MGGSTVCIIQHEEWASRPHSAWLYYADSTNQPCNIFIVCMGGAKASAEVRATL